MNTAAESARREADLQLSMEERLDEARVECIVIGGRPIRVCSRDDLITMKHSAGRPQDLEDLRNLGV